MAINEEKVTGRKFRKLVDEAQKLWQRVSFWTMACDVEFEDGQNLEEKINELSNKIDAINASLPYKITFDGTTMTFTDETRNI